MKKPTPTPTATTTREPQSADLKGQVERIREQISEAKAQLELVDEGGLPRGEFFSNVERWVDDMARKFEADAGYRLSALRLPVPRAADVALGELVVRGGQTPAAVAIADSAPLLCWLLPDLLKQRAKEMIQGIDYVEGPPSADRPRLRRELQHRLDSLEMAEERTICEAEASGVVIPRRVDIRPSIVLSLDLSEAA